MSVVPAKMKNEDTVDVKFRRSRKGDQMNDTMTRTRLTVSDRCDRCGAQAFVRVVLDGGSTLQFCSHHFKEHEVRLRAVAVEVVDESDSIA